MIEITIVYEIDHTDPDDPDIEWEKRYLERKIKEGAPIFVNRDNFQITMKEL